LQLDLEVLAFRSALLDKVRVRERVLDIETELKMIARGIRRKSEYVEVFPSGVNEPMEIASALGAGSVATTLKPRARLPIAREVPAVEILVTEDAPSPLNPLGVKSVGEGGINGVGAVIAAAIDEAIGLPGA